ncbi:MAG: G1 family glutamic endopeptidase [Acidimicrobiales bacterium]
MPRLAGIAAVIALLSALVLSAGGAGASVARADRGASLPRAGGVLIRTDSHEALPVHGGTVTSTNWSGYAVTPSGRGITAVESTFVVPSAGLLPPGFAATWAGIGGYSTSDLMQAGVAEDSLPTLPILGDQYYAWYELLPNAEVQLSGCSGDPDCTVSPGDAITVHIYQDSGKTWTISVVDAGNWSWSSNVNYASSGSSAEWILEAPTVEGLQSTLSNTGTTSFGNVSTYTAGGRTLTIAQGDPTQIDLSLGLFPEGTPSLLAGDGQSFNDCAYALSCPTP